MAADLARAELARVPATQRADTAHGRSDTDSAARAGDVLVAALRSQVAQLRAQDPHVREEVPGAVTLMRVATRRLRPTLSGFSWFLDPEHTQPVAEELMVSPLEPRQGPLADANLAGGSALIARAPVSVSVTVVGHPQS